MLPLNVFREQRLAWKGKQETSGKFKMDLKPRQGPEYRWDTKVCMS